MCNGPNTVSAALQFGDISTRVNREGPEKPLIQNSHIAQFGTLQSGEAMLNSMFYEWSSLWVEKFSLQIDRAATPGPEPVQPRPGSLNPPAICQSQPDEEVQHMRTQYETEPNQQVCHPDPSPLPARIAAKRSEPGPAMLSRADAGPLTGADCRWTLLLVSVGKQTGPRG